MGNPSCLKLLSHRVPQKKSTELALKLMERMGLFTNDNCHNCSPIANATCGAAFRAAFSRADLIVAKRQANFETMNERSVPSCAAKWVPSRRRFKSFSIISERIIET